MSNNSRDPHQVPVPRVLGCHVATKISKEQADIDNLIGAGCEIPLEGDDSDTKITLDRIDAVDSFTEPSALFLMTKHGPIWIKNFRGFLQTLTGFPIDEAQPQDSDWMALVLTRLPSQLVDIFGWIAPVDNILEMKMKSVSVLMRLSTPDVSVATIITTSHSCLSKVLKHPSLNRLTRPDEHCLSLPQFFDCRVGLATITPFTFRNLDSGDILVLDRQFFDADGSGTVQYCGESYRVCMRGLDSEGKPVFECIEQQVSGVELSGSDDALNGQELGVEGSDALQQLANGGEDMTQTETEHPPEEEGATNQICETDESVEREVAADALETHKSEEQIHYSQSASNSSKASRIARPIGKMPVEVSAVLGTFMIDVANDRKLAQGDILNLQTDCPGFVTLVCRDHEIGRGELVDIDGRLGVKITHNWCK